MKYLPVISCLGLIILLTGCISQKAIETACLQTLSASTPVCACEAAIKETEPPQVIQQVIVVTATQQPTVANTEPPPPPKPGRIIFSADFESGDLSVFDGKDGEYFGKGVFYDIGVVKSPAQGNYSAALTIGSGPSTAAYLFTYDVPATPLGYYSADFFVPGNIITGDWWNVWQWKSVDESYTKPIIHLNIIRDHGYFYLVMFYTAGGTTANPDAIIEPINSHIFPPDQWVNITGYYYSASDESGYVEVYMDGVKVYELRNIVTKPGNQNVLWSVNSYAGEISPDPATFYVDNLKIGEMN
jgi:hypothetical protein